MSAASPTHLMDLPLELRLHIYDYVCHLALDVQLLAVDQRPDSKLLRSKRNHRIRMIKMVPITEVNIAWISLLNCCKSIRVELTDHMKSTTFLSNHWNRTYTLEKQLTQTGDILTTWCQIPCPMSAVRRLVINGPLDEEHITETLHSVEHTLRRFVKCGLSFDHGRPLSDKLELDELQVEFSEDAVPLDPRILASGEYSTFEQRKLALTSLCIRDTEVSRWVDTVRGGRFDKIVKRVTVRSGTVVWQTQAR